MVRFRFEDRVRQRRFDALLVTGHNALRRGDVAFAEHALSEAQEIHPEAEGVNRLAAAYVRSPERLRACIDLLLRAGGVTKVTEPAVIDLLGGRLHSLDQHLVADMSLLTRQIPALGFGPSGGPLLTLSGATLLHVAAEYHELEAARLLLDRGANVNAPAAVDDAGVGGQTAIFHAVTQSGDEGLPMTQFLVDRGADLSVRVKLPGDYEQPGEVVECTALGYARRFQKAFHAESRTIAFLRERGAVE